MVKTPWIFFNMNQWEWSKLPWPEKKKLILELVEAPLINEGPTKEDFSNLFKAWTKYNAETFTIQQNYPQTKEYLK